MTSPLTQLQAQEAALASAVSATARAVRGMGVPLDDALADLQSALSERRQHRVDCMSRFAGMLLDAASEHAGAAAGILLALPASGEPEQLLGVASARSLRSSAPIPLPPGPPASETARRAALAEDSLDRCLVRAEAALPADARKEIDAAIGSIRPAAGDSPPRTAAQQARLNGWDGKSCPYCSSLHTISGKRQDGVRVWMCEDCGSGAAAAADPAEEAIAASRAGVAAVMAACPPVTKLRNSVTTQTADDAMSREEVQAELAAAGIDTTAATREVLDAVAIANGEDQHPVGVDPLSPAGDYCMSPEQIRIAKKNVMEAAAAAKGKVIDLIDLRPMSAALVHATPHPVEGDPFLPASAGSPLTDDQIKRASGLMPHDIDLLLARSESDDIVSGDEPPPVEKCGQAVTVANPPAHDPVAAAVEIVRRNPDMTVIIGSPDGGVIVRDDARPEPARPELEIIAVEPLEADKPTGGVKKRVFAENYRQRIVAASVALAAARASLGLDAVDRVAQLREALADLGAVECRRASAATRQWAEKVVADAEAWLAEGGVS